MQDARTLFEQGLARHLARDWAAAEAAYRGAHALVPGRPSVLFNLGRLMLDLHRDAEAGEFFEQVLAVAPQEPEALAGLGESQARRGQHAAALASHASAVAQAPGVPELQANFARCAAHARLGPGDIDVARLEPALLACLQGDAIDPQALAAVSSLVLHAKHPFAWEGGDPSGLMADRLAHLALEKIIVANAVDEAFFTKLRRDFLLSREAVVPAAFALALACQCFLNEYVWDVSDEEAATLGRLDSMARNLARFALLACYRKPVRADAEGCNLPGPVLSRLILEPEMEAALAESLPGARIDDAVSRGVQAMYEDNPYPRWTGMFALREASYVDWILDDIAPQAPDLEPAAPNPRILVAGGGTGRDPLAYARFCRGARVRSIDLSRASLAHARRKAQELGVRNLDLAQQDILSLEEEGEYDVVSCRGVLHHLKEPEAGLQRLVQALKPGGYMMLALYSRAARRALEPMRALILQEGYRPTPKGAAAASACGSNSRVRCWARSISTPCR